MPSGIELTIDPIPQSVGPVWWRRLLRRLLPGRKVNLTSDGIRSHHRRIDRLLIAFWGHYMFEDATYAEVIRREGADDLYLGYCNRTTKCFYCMDDLVDWFLENDALHDNPNLISYLEEEYQK